MPPKRQPTPKRQAKSPARQRRPSRPDEKRIDPDALEAGSPSKKKDAEETKDREAGLKGDYGAIALLMLLYTLQGIPMGLSGSMGLLLTERKISSADQAVWALIAFPFAFKLLWAPLVDSVYSSTFGRRKTWIVPVQAVIGVLLLVSAGRVEGLMGPVPQEGGVSEVDIKSLTVLFFSFYFLAATQDIAVDGLALTVLSERNKELGATCNAIGQTLGFFLSNVGFLILNAKGLATLGTFMAFWGWVFIGSTIWVLTVRKDEFHAPPHGVVREMRDAYAEMFVVLKLPPLRRLALILLTIKLPLVHVDALVTLELLAKPISLPKEQLASLSIIMLPVGMLAQAYVSKSFSGADSKPLHVFLLSYKARLVFGLVISFFVLALRQMTADGGTIPYYMYVGGLLLLMASSAVTSAMFVAQMAFYNRVSDPRIGGTYMTMLNTISNLGGQWPGPAVFTLKSYVEKVPGLDAFGILCVLCTALGVAWITFLGSWVGALQERPVKDWHAIKLVEEPAEMVPPRNTPKRASK